MKRLPETCVVVILLWIASRPIVAKDWPQLHGPRRDNMSSDTGLLKTWPDGGPRLIWRASGLGHGFASVAIVDGMIYTTGDIEKKTVITALDLSGKILWRQQNGPVYRGSYPGTRSTPTVVDNKLYNLNGNGDLLCAYALTGVKIWSLNILKKFKGRSVRWGIAESPLIVGNTVICSPGGEHVSMAALDKDTGETLWTCSGAKDKPGYATPAWVEYGGLRQIVTLMSASAVGVAADTGALLWQYPHAVRHGANCDTPLYHDGHVYLFGTFGFGATKLKLNVKGNTCSVEKVWHTTVLDNEHGGVLIVDGYLYGQADANHKRRHWACLDLKTGKTMWTAWELAGRASATQTYADGMLYVISDRGEVGLVRPNPKRMDIVSQFHLPKDGRGVVYARPVVCDGRFYIRHGEYLYAYDVRSVGASPGRS